MTEQPSATSKGPRGAYAQLICLGCHERRIKCELPDDVDVPEPGELRTLSSPCYRCRKLGIPCNVRRTRLGRPRPDDGSTTLAGESQDEARPVIRSANHSMLSQGTYHVESRDAALPTPQPDSLSFSIPRHTTPAKIQILPLRRAALQSRPPVTTEDTSSSSDGQPIKAKRTRAGKPKAKTGCLTCKIRRVYDHLLMSVTRPLTFPVRSSAMKPNLRV